MAYNDPTARTLLVSDDEASLAAFAQCLQGEHGFVQIAGDADAVLEWARSHSPDLIVLDADLPEMNGYKACQSLKSDPVLRQISVILIVRADDSAGSAKGLESGADDLLTKPVDHSELLARIRSHRQLKVLGERVASYRRTQKALAQLTALTGEEPTSVLDALAGKAAELTGMDRVCITTGDPKNIEVIATYSSSETPGDIGDPTLDARVAEVRLARGVVVHEDGPECYIGIPLMSTDGRFRGVLHAFGGQSLPAHDRLELLTIASQRISNEVQTVEDSERLRDTVDERTQALEEALDDLAEANRRLVQASEETMSRLAMATELRDIDTGMHIDRMSAYAEAIAVELGWSKDECRRIRQASPMHDVGKIGIPDSILQKQAPLSAEEWEHMRDHPTIGARILSGSRSKLLQMAETIALTHHERFDGAGYPNGLTGEDIPMSGRIVALADVFDALTTTRCYKEAWSVDKALEGVREESGKHFDPVVVEAFFRALPRIKSIFRGDKSSKGSQSATG